MLIIHFEKLRKSCLLTIDAREHIHGATTARLPCRPRLPRPLPRATSAAPAPDGYRGRARSQGLPPPTRPLPTRTPGRTATHSLGVARVTGSSAIFMQGDSSGPPFARLAGSAAIFVQGDSHGPSFARLAGTPVEGRS